MGNMRLKLLATCAAITLAGSAEAATSLNFSGGGDSFAVVGPFSERQISFTGTANFATEIVSGVYTKADLTGFTVNMHVAYHPSAAPLGFFITADYAFTLADLTSLAVTFDNYQPIAAVWSLTPKTPYQSMPSGFQPPIGFDVDGAKDKDGPSVTFTQTIDGRSTPIMLGDIADVTTSVPEPSSWMLMVGGFGVAGAAMRGRRKAAVSFA